MARQESIEIKLLKLKETKTTWVYESSEGAPLRNLYVNKGALRPMPDAIWVTIQAVAAPTAEES